MVSSAVERKVKYSIVVPVYNNAADLRACLSSINAQVCNHDLFEVIVVDNNSTDESASVAKAAGVVCLGERDFQSSYAARNRGIKAARGEFVVFIDSDCVAHPEWLSRIDAETSDGKVGCFAGEILSLSPTTMVERFSESIGLLRQRGPLSGWHFKPYAQTANAVYRKTVFEKVGLFDPTMKSGGDAALAWRMLDQTEFRVQFIPDAIVYHHHRTSLPDLWSQFRRYGGGKISWALAQSDYEPPSVTKLEGELVTAFNDLVSNLEASGTTGEKFVFPLLRSITQVAHYSGYLQDLLKLMSRDAPIPNWLDIACAHAVACNICGSRAFIPGPRKRMVSGRAPQCFRCGSLERHRILHAVLSVLERDELARWTCLNVGEPLPKSLSWFAEVRHTELAGLAVREMAAPCDLVVATNVLSRIDNRSVENLLSTLVSPLRDHGMLLLLDRASQQGDRDSAGNFESMIAQHLPNVTVRSSWAQDDVTGVTKVVTLASPDAFRVSQVASRLNRKAPTVIPPSLDGRRAIRSLE